MSELARLLDVADVADITGLSHDTIRRAIRAGELPASRIRRRIRIHPSDLAAWIDHNRVEPDQPLTPASPFTPPPRSRPTTTLSFTERAKRAA